MVPFERALVSSYRPSIVDLILSSIFTRFRDIVAFVLHARHFFQPATKSEGVRLIVRQLVSKISIAIRSQDRALHSTSASRGKNY